MHQPFSGSFSSLVAIVVMCLPNADLWLSFKSQWRKYVMHILSSVGMVWYSVPSQIVAGTSF